MNQAVWTHTQESGCECLAHERTHETQKTLVLLCRRWASEEEIDRFLGIMWWRTWEGVCC